MKKNQLLKITIRLILLSALTLGCKPNSVESLHTEIIVNPNVVMLNIDGFGVNITPAQWHDGKLKTAIDMLTDDLGSTLFRFDCTGLANWLDPSKRDSAGKWSYNYLDSVYSSKVFTDAWETFRYLNHKGVEPFFNVSGRIDPGLGKQDAPNTLADFEGYAEMVVSMVKWAREREHLKFTLLAPFNETNLGYPEGPAIGGPEMVTVTRAIIRKLDENGLSDIRLIDFDDNVPNIDKLETVLSDTSIADRIAVFGTHTYGNGDVGEDESWNNSPTDYLKFSEKIRESAFRKSAVWMTEYGDLDQTGEIEYEFARRSTKRLMKSFHDGFSAAMAWDAFDNFHEHDTVWATYGLLKTDTLSWTYTPKKRYYAARQVYRFVRPDWKMVSISTSQQSKFDIYKIWHDIFRHIRIQAFISPDGKDYTLLVMNAIERPVDLIVHLPGINDDAGLKPVSHFVTDRNTNCKMIKRSTIIDHALRVTLPENSISTITTLN